MFLLRVNLGRQTLGGMWDTLYVCDLILSSNILFIKEKEKNLRFTLSNNNYDSRKPHFTDANPGKY